MPPIAGAHTIGGWVQDRATNALIQFGWDRRAAARLVERFPLPATRSISLKTIADALLMAGAEPSGVMTLAMMVAAALNGAKPARGSLESGELPEPWDTDETELFGYLRASWPAAVEVYRRLRTERKCVDLAANDVGW